MADEDNKKPVKVGVKEGGGPPPGYLWNVNILDHAYREARAFLDDDQYAHIASQFRELAGEVEPTQSLTVDVRPIDDFFELRDKGGLLKKINVRVFFCLCKITRTITVLGAINKKNDDQTSPYAKILMRNRMHRYQ